MKGLGGLQNENIPQKKSTRRGKDSVDLAEMTEAGKVFQRIQDDGIKEDGREEEEQKKNLRRMRGA